MFTMVLAEDHKLVSDGLRRILSAEAYFQIIDQVSDGLAAVQAVERLKPSMLLLDLALPRLHGLEVLRRLHNQRDTRSVVVSIHDGLPYVMEAFRNGAAGYVLKDCQASVLIEAIRTVASGEAYIVPELKNSLITTALRQSIVKPSAEKDILTDREQEILKLTALGETSAEIGRVLSLSPRTVESHRTGFRTKLGLKSQSDLVRYAIRNNLISA